MTTRTKAYSKALELITPGTVYTYPLGARKKLKVVSDVPFRHICFCPPSPNYPFPTLAELRGGAG